MAGPYFIALEGVDGSGTTTQARRLSDALRERGHRVLETREPSGGSIGCLVREQLADGAPLGPAALALLFAADRLEHLQREIEPALARGEVVVCDRYVLSSWAYQGLDCPPDWVRTINEQARWPDLTLLLDLEPELALARVAARRRIDRSAAERFDDAAVQRRLVAAYRALAADPALAGVVLLDAARTPEDVTRAALGACAQRGL